MERIFGQGIAIGEQGLHHAIKNRNSNINKRTMNRCLFCKVRVAL
jgi:hypothetical protein